MFLKTDCYHYFHSLCLLRYVRYHQQEAAEAVDEERGRGEIPAANQKPLECPVCREQISKGVDQDTIGSPQDTIL